MPKIIDSFSGKTYFLSNFSRGSTRIHINGIDLAGPTVEHVYQAAKTKDEETVRRILSAETPRRAKRLGVKAPIIPDWESKKHIIMLKLLEAKFTDPSLKKKLLDTEDSILIKGNYWHDTHWGRCTCPGHKNSGENILGKMIMKIRNEAKAK